ncbi:helix-turn-helix domain-containing protein [Gordonia amarae]|uniref:Helix-turn-helix domain-containing protein n=2 Tax=Gordonia amarae TaxID=36821 RepID=A0A857KJ81_9ACTN|nr:helix-turn-helix domain-containing protein [Gordonia amarae]MCS3877448.1 transcriptional regulator with XRE-family HTH domain [Gordonia amarae]QHN16187.1 helix-turn-helix domain-containing protein [Gordonia amarae]QHN20755.1 helix-turn-helix domain-containing protein [Gordonia amarae]QHN29607.1 helix-turn-helix domain-containing protein [Gordonia amarae]QHN38383.1 helix-turn-helix domain-containing protein [Gordonia amarae]
MGRQEPSLHPAAREALRVLGAQVRAARIEKRWTGADLARAAGVSRYTITQIENGAPSVAVGNVLSVAAIAGVPLFGAADRAELAVIRARAEDRVALLPSRVDKPKRRMSDDALDF